MSWMTAVASVPDAASVSAPLRMPAGLTLVTAALADRNCCVDELGNSFGQRIARQYFRIGRLLNFASSSVMPTIKRAFGKGDAHRVECRAHRPAWLRPSPTHSTAMTLVSRGMRELNGTRLRPWIRPITLIGQSRLTNSDTRFCA